MRVIIYWLFSLIFLTPDAVQAGVLHKRHRLFFRNFSTVGMHKKQVLFDENRSFRLKNGKIACQKDIVRIMTMLVDIATSNSAARKMHLLLNQYFPKRKSISDTEILQKIGLISPTDVAKETERDILSSSIDLDEENIDLSIIRSPLKGKYLLRPFAMHEGIYDSSSYLYTRRDFSKNKIYLDLLNPNYIVPISFEKQLKRDDEHEPDYLPYAFKNFWEQYGFQSYDEYLDDRLSWELSDEEWIKTRIGR